MQKFRGETKLLVIFLETDSISRLQLGNQGQIPL